MNAPKTVKAHCPNCGPDRNAVVVREHETKWSDDTASVWGEVAYRILECPACEAVYFQREEVFSENEDYRYEPYTGEMVPYIKPEVTFWPAPSRRERPNWLDAFTLDDAILLRVMREVYTALDQDLRVLAAIGVRTAFDRASELLGVDPSLPFGAKLDALATKGKIGADEREILGVLTDAGSAAAHRGWQPDADHLRVMMDTLESFVYRSFVLGDAARKLQASVPARPKRQPAAGQAEG